MKLLLKNIYRSFRYFGLFLYKECKRDIRHLICGIITLISLGFGFLFPNSIPRLAEALRDFFVSLIYYFVQIFAPGNNQITPTVLQMQSWTWADDIWEPLKIFPWTWEEFKILWSNFWRVFFTLENIRKYIIAIGDFCYYGSRFLLILLPLCLVIILVLGSYKNKRCQDRRSKSWFLEAYEKLFTSLIYPGISWLKDFFSFIKEHGAYWKIWVAIWALHFNVISIAVAFLAFYLYFAVAWDWIGIYDQVLKLLIDLAPMVRFIPGIAWAGIGVWAYNYVCRSMAFQRLYHAEKCNRAFLSGRGVVTTVYGVMGVGKTQMITSMALSSEIDQFDMAFEILLEKDAQFPNFPWQIFRDALKKNIDNHTIVDLPTCRKWVQRCKVYFDRISAIYTAAEYQDKRRKYKLFKFDYTFGYDYTHYAVTYNDELKITHLYEALEDYACAYLIFTVKTTLLFANYSIRVDSIISDLGNMPTRDNDFLKRDPKLQDAYSHHSHIIDHDMFRLGTKMIKGNPKARRLSFGTFVITEVDKERKNMQELKETKIKDDECNQRNDLYNACLMMCRHAAVVSNRVFIRIICDLQRPEAWGAGGRELGEVIYIAEKGDLNPALPLISPYWLFQGVYSWVNEKWQDFYSELIVNRSDSTLFIYITKNIMSLISRHYDRVLGLFGTQELKLEIQSGRMDGDVKEDKWRLITKKDRSRRYQTACLEAVFDSYEPNTMHIDDFVMYAGEVGTQAENELQNSFFQNDIKKMRELNK